MTGHFLHSVSIMNVGKMKKMRKWIFIILMAVLLPTCQKPKIEIVDFDTFHVTSVKQSDVIVDGAMNPEIRTMELGKEGNAKNASISLAGLVENLLATMQSNKVIEIAGTYTGHDIDESPITLSGKVMLPAKGKIKKMIIVSHWTIGANRECPSESFQLEGILASKGYAVVMADYIGYGVTANRVHPYMHMESTARSVVDMAATFDIAMLEDKTGIPCAIPLIVQGIRMSGNPYSRNMFVI